MKKPEAHQLDRARQLLAHEGQNAEGGALAAAAGRVHARLFERLSTLVGRGGAHALFARSVKLTMADFLFLKTVDLRAERADDIEAMLVAAFSGESPERISEGAIALSATMLALLETLIGEALTLKVLRSGWPDFVAANEDKENEKR